MSSITSSITYGAATATRAIVSAKATAPARKSLFRRFVAALIASRERSAMEEIRRHRHLLPSELEQAGWKISGRSEDSLPFVR